jgi:hypothetical protein
MDAQTVNDHILARRRYDGALAAGADPRIDGIAVVASQSS